MSSALISHSSSGTSTTPNPISAMFAIREALRLVHEEGLDNRFKRHQINHALLKVGLEELGFEFVVKTGFRLPMLNSVKLPEGWDEADLRSKLLDQYDIEVGGGLGDFAGKIWRVGLMGESSSANHVNMLLAAIRQLTQ